MKRGTPEHPKTHALAALLGVPHWGAVGLMEMLWHFAAQYAHSGDVGRFADEALARSLSYEGDPALLVSSLKVAGLLDPCACHRLRVHDWPDHADQTVQRVLAKRGAGFLPCYDKVEQGYLYCIVQGKAGPAKLGWAKDPRARCAELQIGNPETLVLAGVLSGSRSDEAEVQNRFGSQRIAGEWFELTDEILTTFGVDPSMLASFGSIRASRKTSQPLPLSVAVPLPLANTVAASALSAPGDPSEGESDGGQDREPASSVAAPQGSAGPLLHLRTPAACGGQPQLLRAMPHREQRQVDGAIPSPPASGGVADEGAMPGCDVRLALPLGHELA